VFQRVDRTGVHDYVVMLSSGENLIGAHDGTADQNLLFTDFLTVVRYDNLADFAAWYQISDPVNHHIYSVRILSDDAGRSFYD
jgi:hypothetical protein